MALTWDLEQMRIVTWNCRIGGFRWKAQHVARLRPDVLAVQEVEPIDNVLLFAGDCQPTYRDRVSGREAPRRGIGIFSYTDIQLQAVDSVEPMSTFRRYEARRGDLTFNVIGVWTWATKSASTSYRQAHEGFARYADWIRHRPTVVIGDFNGNGAFQGSNWRQLLELAGSLGLVSAYHHYFGESFGAETRPTHFHKGDKARPFHLDYCFLPDAWAQRIRKVDVGLYSDWCGISDHVPLTVDLEM
jgi:exodeoxyribonuclease III